MIEVRINYKMIRMYMDSGKKLFPLCRKKEFGRVLPLKEQGKKPLHKNYTKRDYPIETLFDYVLDGHNLGWQIGPGYVVVDVDPRNGGDRALPTLCGDVGTDDLGDLCPTVNTGGGGTHYYFQLPDNAPSKFKKQNNKRYPGIDFQHQGQYVVIPGSYHYEAKAFYSWDELSPYELSPPDLPMDVLRHLEYTGPKQSGDAIPGDLTPKELKEILDQIPVEDYDNHDSWFELLCASHYATNGEGDQVFIAWSMGDERYAGDELSIRNRWGTFRSDIQNPITTNTLYKHLLLHGGTPPQNMALEEFGEYLESEKIIEHIKRNEKIKQPSNTLRDKINQLDETSNSRDVTSILKVCLTLNAVQTDIVIRDVSKRTKISKKSLRQQLSGIQKLKHKNSESTVSKEDVDLQDLVQQVVAIVLREYYADGKHLRYTDDGNFWFYDGKKWVKYFEGFIRSDIYEAMMTLRMEVPNIEFEASRVLQPAQKILEAKTASRIRIYDPVLGRQPVINLLDCELWIEPRSGKIKKRKHSPDSNLSYCLDIELDTTATCPLFDKTLKELFALEVEEVDEIIRHLWEVIGYIIQPNKNIASWFMLLGNGSNGKSVIVKVLSALLGDAVLEQCITDFDAKNSFARAELPGKLLIMDDDVTAKTILPDEFMKKMSENKMVSVPQKFKSNIRFRATSTILLSCNDKPKTKDTSFGFYRRVMVFPFRRKFERSEYNHDLGDTIASTELPGVLISALRGLRRLRKRGDFKIPPVCKRAAYSWQNDSNSLYAFISDCCIRNKKAKTKALNLWNLYQYWIEDNGINRAYRMNKRTLFSSLQTMGFEKHRGTGGVYYFRGIEIIDTIETEEG